MIRPLRNLFARLKSEQSGTASVEFVMVVPVYFALLLMSIELGFITLRHALLERGLDIAVREVRLSTDDVPGYEEIKSMVCDNALFIANCDTNLRLEMIKDDIRAYNGISDNVQCEDAAQPTNPDDIVFDTTALPNELMLIRACYRYNPLFPQAILGTALTKDANGQAQIVSMSAFVQEPL